MKVYCEFCDFKKNYDGVSKLRKCPKCNIPELHFEENLSWNILSALWAISKGWKPIEFDGTLPEWICKTDRMLFEWNEFKTRLRNPQIIGPPPFEGLCKFEGIEEEMRKSKAAFEWHWKAYDFWLEKTGINFMYERAIKSNENREDLYRKCQPLIDTLGEAYVRHWKRRMRDTECKTS